MVIQSSWLGLTLMPFAATQEKSKLHIGPYSKKNNQGYNWFIELPWIDDKSQQLLSLRQCGFLPFTSLLYSIWNGRKSLGNISVSFWSIRQVKPLIMLEVHMRCHTFFMSVITYWCAFYSSEKMREKKWICLQFYITPLHYAPVIFFNFVALFFCFLVNMLLF